MSEQQETSQKQEAKPKSSYNTFSHMVDKGILNFCVGSGVTIGIILLLGISLAGKSVRGCIPLIIFAVVAIGFAYAFGGIGVNAGISKQEGFKVTKTSGILAAIVGSSAYVFPMFFFQVILNFISFVLPAYNGVLISFMPRPKFSYLYLVNTFCEKGTREFCFFDSQFGRLSSYLLDVLMLCIGLMVVFSVINCITVLFKVSSK